MIREEEKEEEVVEVEGRGGRWKGVEGERVRGARDGNWD